MSLVKKPTDSFSNTETVYPHLRLHILLSILAVTIVLGSIWTHKMNTNTNYKEVIVTPASYPSTDEELRLIAKKISSAPSEDPPTQSELEMMAAKMSKMNVSDNVLSGSDLELQAQILNK